ncbi:hypothetical protein GBAR_LOCUS20726, partial [Geodia barretti]
LQRPEESPPRHQVQACGREEEEEKEPQGELLHLHLQGSEAGSPRHWHLQQGHEHHELVRQRHLRAYRHRGLPSCSLQQETHDHQPRGADSRPPSPARRTEQARSQRGHQGRHQIHQQQVERLLSSTPFILFFLLNRLFSKPPQLQLMPSQCY